MFLVSLSMRSDLLLLHTVEREVLPPIGNLTNLSALQESMDETCAGKF